MIGARPRQCCSNLSRLLLPITWSLDKVPQPDSVVSCWLCEENLHIMFYMSINHNTNHNTPVAFIQLSQINIFELFLQLVHLHTGCLLKVILKGAQGYRNVNRQPLLRCQPHSQHSSSVYYSLQSCSGNSVKYFYLNTVHISTGYCSTSLPMQAGIASD